MGGLKAGLRTVGLRTTTDQRYFVYDGDQMVLVMDAGNAWDLWTGHPQAFARTYPLGIYEAPRPSTALAQVPDPYDRSPAESVACYQQIARCIDGLLAKWMVARRPALIV